MGAKIFFGVHVPVPIGTGPIPKGSFTTQDPSNRIAQITVRFQIGAKIFFGVNVPIPIGTSPIPKGDFTIQDLLNRIA
jgi:hypothetical protein